MPPSQIYEIIGYAASLLVAISLMMSSILKLRVINLVGALFFTAYGLLIRAYPVAVVNFFIVLIDLYYLVQMLTSKEFFELLAVRPESEYLDSFLHHYAADIQKFQPGFAFSPNKNLLVFFILRNLVPAGLLIGDIRGESGLHILLDYAIPGYRDLKIGRFLYQQHAADFRSRGIQKIYAQPGAAAHARYLEQMGFRPETGAQGEPLYSLSLG
jgi:ribosomal protein S18 acetylase RimI-like enzyme